MVIKCAGCGEQYDTDMFPVCPFCMTPNSVEGQTEETITDILDKVEPVCEESEPSLANIHNVIEDDHNGEQETQQELENTISAAVKDDPIDSELASEKESAIDQADIRLADILGLSTRTRNVLFRHSIFTMSDLLRFYKESDLSKLHNAGAKTISEITELIEKYQKQTMAVFPDNRLDGTKLIRNIFSENKFNIFVSYCAANGIVTIEDLSGFDFELLKNVQGIGTRKVKDIIAKYRESSVSFSEINGGEESTLSLSLSNQERLFEYINEQLRELEIDFLFGLNIRAKQIEALQKKGITIIGDLEGISVDRLSAIVGNHNIDKFRNISPMFQYNLTELFEKVLTASSEDNNYIITLFRAEGYTLKDIGELVGLTRERVRQIVGKYLRSLNSFMVPIIDYFMNPKGFVTVQELIDIYDNDDFDKILILWCKNSDHVHYLKYADVFLPITENLRSIEANLSTLAEEFVGDGITLSDSIDELGSMLQENNCFYLDTDAFIAFMQYQGYRVYGDCIFKGRQSYGSLCARIVAKRFTDGIKLYDSHDLNLLRQYALEEYGDIGLPSDDRALSSRVSEFLVLRGRGMYISEENIYVESQLLEELKAYINSQPEAEIYYADLFAKHEGMIRMMSSIDNYNYLHGVLKLYCGEEYDFNNRDYLIKRGDGLISGKFSDRLRKFIVTSGKPVHKRDIKREFPGVTDIVLSSTMIYDESLFQWDYNVFSSMDLIRLTEQDKDYLKTAITEIMSTTNGYCSDNMLFSEVYHHCSEIINKNNMTDANNLYYLCAKIFSKQFDFRRPHICQMGLLEAMSVKNIALLMLNNPNRLSFGDYQKIANQLQWSAVTTGVVFADIEKDYFRVNDDLYIKENTLCMPQDFLNKVEAWLRTRLEKGFISLITIDFDGLPDFEYDWNNHLLRSIVDKYLPSFKIVETRNKDRRYERGIIIDAESPIKDYQDLVVWLMKKNGFTELPENKMLSLLVVNGLTYKLIPK